MLLRLAMAGLVVVAILGIGAHVWLGRLPSVANLPARVRQTLAKHHAPYTPYATMPSRLVQAIVSTEDKRFWYDPGLDPIAIARATFDDLRAGSLIEGGSTITEQLAKNVYVGSDHSLRLKLESMGLALVIASRYSKREVLTLYLNRVYLGHGAYGVGAASTIYFHEPVSRLDLSECALLAGLPQAPSAYDPLVHPRAAERRQTEVLNLMLAHGFITTAQARHAERTLAQEIANKTL